MAGFNLIRKRRRRLPKKAIGIVLGVLVLGGAVYAVIVQVTGGGILGSANDQVDIHVIDRSGLSGYQPEGSSESYDYAAADESKGVFARGATLTFSLLPKSTVSGSVKLQNVDLVIRSFTPIEKLQPSPTYKPPSGKEEAAAQDEDVLAEIAPEAGKLSVVTWQPQSFPVPEGRQPVTAVQKPKQPVMVPLMPKDISTPLSTINAPDTHRFMTKLVLTVPGQAVVGLRARYLLETRQGTAESPESITLIFNPDVDAGSVAYYQAAFETTPSFFHARALRDAQLKEGQKDEALDTAVKYRNGEPGMDASWLVGDTHRARGEYQQALDDGYLDFVRNTKDYEGDRLKRWEEARQWSTEMVQSGKAKLHD